MRIKVRSYLASVCIGRRRRTKVGIASTRATMSADIGRCPTTLVWMHLKGHCANCIVTLYIGLDVVLINKHGGQQECWNIIMAPSRFSFLSTISTDNADSPPPPPIVEEIVTGKLIGVNCSESLFDISGFYFVLPGEWQSHQHEVCRM